MADRPPPPRPGPPLRVPPGYRPPLGVPPHLGPRRPIYRDATEEWRPYEKFLGPLKAALGPVLDSYPEAPAT